ncbi:hypothetical protein F4819DRAFT_65659 [Hypoxylon fuscum]|nr:hypothetical protein F4819DRAFT_65659 [Hypoxylon fuscum]
MSNMPNDTISIGLGLSTCQSSPHTSASTATEQASFQTQRLSSVTHNSSNFTDRLVSGSTGYDHTAAASATLSAFTTSFNGTAGGN